MKATNAIPEHENIIMGYNTGFFRSVRALHILIHFLKVWGPLPRTRWNYKIHLIRLLLCQDISGTVDSHYKSWTSWNNNKIAAIMKKNAFFLLACSTISSSTSLRGVHCVVWGGVGWAWGGLLICFLLCYDPEVRKMAKLTSCLVHI